MHFFLFIYLFTSIIIYRELCVDAIVDDGDRNKDWKLDFEEFTRVMNPSYQPNEKGIHNF